MLIPETLYECSVAFISKIRELPVSEHEMLTQCLYAAAAYHDNQYRKSGPPYIIHPIQVALILLLSKQDGATVAAGLLHDVVEDTSITGEEIRQRFGKEVAFLVESVTNQAMFSNKEFLEKVYTKSKEDNRVASLKIADRCANLLDDHIVSLNPEKQLSQLEETQHFYIETLAEIPDISPVLKKFLWQCYSNAAAKCSLPSNL